MVQTAPEASPLNNHDSRSDLCVRRSPLPGNRIPRLETARPKTPASRHGSRERLKRESRRPPIRGYSTAAGKSPVARECVVGLEGLEPPANGCLKSLFHHPRGSKAIASRFILTAPHRRLPSLVYSISPFCGDEAPSQPLVSKVVRPIVRASINTAPSQIHW